MAQHTDLPTCHSPPLITAESKGRFWADLTEGWNLERAAFMHRDGQVEELVGMRCCGRADTGGADEHRAACICRGLQDGAVTQRQHLSQ